MRVILIIYFLLVTLVFGSSLQFHWDKTDFLWKIFGFLVPLVSFSIVIRAFTDKEKLLYGWQLVGLAALIQVLSLLMNSPVTTVTLQVFCYQLTMFLFLINPKSQIIPWSFSLVVLTGLISGVSLIKVGVAMPMFIFWLFGAFTSMMGCLLISKYLKSQTEKT